MQDDKLNMSSPSKGRRSGRRVYTFFLLLALLAAAGGGYWWFDNLDKIDSASDTRHALSVPATPDAADTTQAGHALLSSGDHSELSGETVRQHEEEADSYSVPEEHAVQNVHTECTQATTAEAGPQDSTMESAESLAHSTDLNEAGSGNTLAPSGELTEAPVAPGAEVRFALDRQDITPAASEGRQDDAVVSSRFTGDLARWMVQAYRPGRGDKGYLATGIQAANMRYGTSLQGFNWSGDDLRVGRRDILQYVFTPGMLNGLYRLYVDQFFQNLESATAVRGLTETQTDDMCMLYARQFKGLAGVLEGLAAMPDLAERLAGLTALTREVAEADSRYGMLVVERERAKMAGDVVKVRALNKDVGRAMRIYQQTLSKRDRETKALVRAIKVHNDARLLEDSTILFVSSWVGRRFAQQQNVQSVRTAAEISADLARRLTNRARS